MRKLLRPVTAVVVLTLGAKPAAAADLALTSDDQKAIYAIGLALSRNVVPFGLSENELPALLAGLTDGVLGREPKVNLQEQSANIQALAKARQSKAAAAEKSKAAAFLDAQAKADGAERSASGLIYVEIEEGTGASPAQTDKVKVHYHGTLSDGTVFDSSVERGEPATFPLNRVIKCWTEGVQKMKEGGKSKLVCPSDIAYGDAGSPPKIKPGAALVFEVELIEIVD